MPKEGIELSWYPLPRHPCTYFIVEHTEDRLCMKASGVVPLLALIFCYTLKRGSGAAELELWGWSSPFTS